METQTIEEIKRVIMTELPGLMKSDPDMRSFILNVTRESYSDKRETESRFDRIMDELKRDREAQEKKWDEEHKIQEEKWASQDKKWDEERKVQDKKWEAQEKKWAAWEKKWDEEHKVQKEKWEAWEKKWDEEHKIQKEKWEAQEKKWEENQRVINDLLESVKKLGQKHDSTLGALGARWGLHSESAFRKGLRAILEGSFGVKVERYEDYDHEGTVFGRPEQIELDVLIHNGTLILCEIKSSMSKSELYTFWRKKNFYEDKHARKASRAMVISPMVDAYALAAAEQLDIEIYGYAEDVKP